MEPVKSELCGTCKKHVRVKKDGDLYKHPCQAPDAGAVAAMRSVMEAAPPATAPDPFTTSTPVGQPQDGTLYGKGPWSGATYAGECEGCLNRFEEGDQIRANGEGGWECEAWCGQEDPVKGLETLSDAVRDAGMRPVGVPSIPLDPPVDEFTTSTPVAPPQDEKIVNGAYQVKDPETGDYRRRKNGNVHGYTRATTFIKAASDSFALNQWGKRNIVIGMAMEPQLSIRAAGLTHENDRQALDDLAEAASKLAGAKVAADTGTEIHKLTERLDAGEITLDDITNPTYRTVVERYVACLAEHGLEAVPGLIERTILVKEYGGVCGTFDRVYYHRPSDTYVIGDVKSGKTLKYGKNEIEAQLGLYEMGFNAWGVYDWVAKEWERFVDPLRDRRVVVREDYAVVIHMPVQGDDAFHVTARRADLANGRRHIERCHDVRTQGGGDMKPLGDVLLLPATPARIVDAATFLQAPHSGPNWPLLFGSVRSREEAAKLYDLAVEAGVGGDELAGCVMGARAALQALSQG